jgi:hypothetical protein
MHKWTALLALPTAVVVAIAVVLRLVLALLVSRRFGEGNSGHSSRNKVQGWRNTLILTTNCPQPA